MNKRYNPLIILPVIDAILIAAYGLSHSALAMNGMAYRNSVKYAFFAAIVVLSFVILVLLIRSLFRKAMNKQARKSARVIFVIVGILLIFGILVASLNGSLLCIFTHKPEHVVDKDGVKMVAYVDSFLQVEVVYYEYISPIVRSSRRRIVEDYGNGGYDPFERTEMPEVKFYIYYDEDGNVIKSNWLPLAD